MNEQELREHRRGFLVRSVRTMDTLSEQLLNDYEQWVNKLSDAEFDLYLEEYDSLGEHIWGSLVSEPRTAGVKDLMSRLSSTRSAKSLIGSCSGYAGTRRVSFPPWPSGRPAKLKRSSTPAPKRRRVVAGEFPRGGRA